MNKRNYQKELEQLIKKQEKDNIVPSLLLHSCCAPCSSYCIEYLSNYFKITVYYYNPNISEKEEYEKRTIEQQRLIESMDTKYPVEFIEGIYNPQEFYEIAKGYEKCPERGERCFRCYELRMRSTANKCKELGLDYFATTLTLSPLKDAQKLNEIGEMLSNELEVKYLISDFKKNNGYKRSIELSKEYDLYRQNYCGCAFSRAEAMEREKNNKKN